MTPKLRKLAQQVLANYYLLRLQENQWRSQNRLRSLQFRKLKTIIKHAYDHVPFYHRLFSSVSITPRDIRRKEDLEKIPLTSKQDIQRNYKDLVMKNVDESKLISRWTSGSTGTPTEFFEVDSIMRAGFHTALNLFPFFEFGVKSSEKFVLISARPQSTFWPKKYTMLLGSIPIISIPLLSPRTRLIKMLRYINPDIIWTFPPVLDSLANHDVTGIHPRLIITQGGIVTQHFRDLMGEMFGSEVFETYGSVEFSHLAFECGCHSGLHMITDGAYIEFVDDEGELVPSEEPGEIIVTGLSNYAMPLIRYRIGDVGTPTDERCRCGRSWPLIKDIQGRSDEWISLSNGAKISLPHIVPHFYKELKGNVSSISQFQIIQETRKTIIFKVMKGKSFDPKILERIKRNLETYFSGLGENLEVVMQIVEEIPIERGKRRTLISKVD